MIINLDEKYLTQFCLEFNKSFLSLNVKNAQKNISLANIK